MSVSSIGSSGSGTAFNVGITSAYTTVILTQQQPAGAYTFTSALSNITMDLYFYNSTGNLVASTNGKSINPSIGFSKIVIIGGTSGDVLSFAFQTTYYGTAETAETTAGPVILSVTPTSLPNVNSTTTVTGLNFASNVTATFTGTDNLTRNAKSVVYGSATSLIVTRPDSMPVTYSPYVLAVSNPGVTPPTGSLKNQISVTAGVNPVWQTSAGALTAGYAGLAYSTTVSATDADGGSSVTYSVTSGALPTGLTLTSSTGVISGTLSSTQTTYNFTLTATDSGGNTANQAFSITVGAAPTVEVLVVAGGGGGGYGAGYETSGGGGAGGVRNNTSFLLTSSTITVGAGGAGGVTNNVLGGNGGYSQVGSYQATGGGTGGTYTNSGQNGGSGGGGAGGGSSTYGTGNAGSYSPSEGNNGGSKVGSTASTYGGGGGGAGGSGSTSGGNGAAYSTTGSSVTYGGGGGGGGTYSGGGGSGGGSGGGGNGSFNSTGGAGTNNLGGGGGGANDSNTGRPGGNGGSGVVVIAYPTSLPTLGTIGAGLTYTYSTSSRSGYRVYTFTAGTGTVSF